MEDPTAKCFGGPDLGIGAYIMECCRVDDTSPENMIVGLPPMLADSARLYISINPPQPGGMRASSTSPSIFWWSERHTTDNRKGI